MTLKNPTTTNTQSSGDEAPQGLKLLRTLRGHEDMIGRIAWSPDGQTLAIGSYEDIRLWSAQTVAIVTLEGHSNWVTDLAWSPDGRTLASGSWDATVIIWDAGRLEKTNVLEGHANWITSVAFS